MRKFTVVIFNQLNIKNNKINKDNFEKIHNKKKIMWGNTVAIHSVFLKNTKLNSQPTQYEKNKINKYNSGKITKTS
jgi:putative cell wall-binding protein